MPSSELRPKVRPVKEFYEKPKLNLALLQQLVAEFLASFIFIFILGGNTLSNFATGNTSLGGQDGTNKTAAFLTAIGLTYAFGQKSGAHFNPVLTVGLMFAMRMNWIIGLAYLLIQWLAGFAAIGILLALFPDPAEGSLKDQLVLTPPNNVTQAGWFFFQFLVSTFLVFTYLFFVYDRRPKKTEEGMDKREKAQVEEDALRYMTRLNLVPLIMGCVYAAATVYDHPWRALCACMIAQECGAAWVYCVGGFLGAFAGAVFYTFIWGLGQPATKVTTNPIVPPIDFDEQ